MKMTTPSSRFFSLGCSISRLTCAKVSLAAHCQHRVPEADEKEIQDVPEKVPFSSLRLPVHAEWRRDESGLGGS